MSLLTTDAVVLHSFDYLETSRIFRFATRDAGVISVLARGARTSKRRFGTALDLFASGIQWQVQCWSCCNFHHGDLHLHPAIGDPHRKAEAVVAQVEHRQAVDPTGTLAGHRQQLISHSESVPPEVIISAGWWPL